MGKHWCLNGIMKNTDNYSSPVPLIGLYIAAATLVCLVFIICDIWAGFRSKKSWLPCRFFSLHSVTLTLISVSTKLPIDLTSPMPSSQDQLSKLTGTIFICMCMAFLMPSTGIMTEFDSYTNTVALSIFVITVVVNICIQIATGVIFVFVREHVIILFCMLMLMLSFWVSSFRVNDWKDAYIDPNRDLVHKGAEESLLQRVQVCYLHGYHSSPQFFLCRITLCGTVSLICTICFGVLVEALLRSLVFRDLKFCKGVSAYGWSMWVVVGSQILTAVVVSFAIGCRWFTFAHQFSTNHTLQFPYRLYLKVAYPLFMPKWMSLFCTLVRKFLGNPGRNLVTNFVNFVSRILWLLIKKIRCLPKHPDARYTKHFEDLLQAHEVYVEDWILSKGVEDMDTWIKTTKRKHPQHLRNLLLTTKPSEKLLRNELRWQFDTTAGRDTSCLSVVLLVEMAKVSLPNAHIASLVDILDEVFQIIYFIDNKMNAGSFNSKLKSRAAKVLWKAKTTSTVIVGRRNVKRSIDQSETDLSHALELISEFPHSFVDAVVSDEACAIVEFIKRRLYTSLNDLYDQIKLLLVDMLLGHLTHFPKVVLNHIAESPLEEYEDRVRLALTYICEMGSVEFYVRWSLPIGCNITSLINAQVSAADSQSKAPVGGNGVSAITPVIEDIGVIEAFRQNDYV